MESLSTYPQVKFPNFPLHVQYTFHILFYEQSQILVHYLQRVSASSIRSNQTGPMEPYTHALPLIHLPCPRPLYTYTIRLGPAYVAKACFSPTLQSSFTLLY